MSVSASTRSEALEFSRCHSRTFADFCIIDCSKQNRTEQSRQRERIPQVACWHCRENEPQTSPLWGSLLVYLILAEFTLKQVLLLLTTAIEGSHPHSNFDLITRHGAGAGLE